MSDNDLPSINFDSKTPRPKLPSHCTTCDKPASRQCGRCKSSTYCSKECQKKDWPVHKITCGQFQSLGPRPSPQHRLVVYLPANDPNLKLEWLECTRRVTTETFRDRLYPNSNEHLVGFTEVTRGDGDRDYEKYYTIHLYSRETFMFDGSEINGSISYLTKGKCGDKMRGPMFLVNCWIQEPSDDDKVAVPDIWDFTASDLSHAAHFFSRERRKALNVNIFSPSTGPYGNIIRI